MSEIFEDAIIFLKNFLLSIQNRLNTLKIKLSQNPKELRKLMIMWHFSVKFFSLLKNKYNKFSDKNIYAEKLEELEKLLEAISGKMKRISPWEIFNEIVIIQKLINLSPKTDERTLIELDNEFNRVLKVQDRRYAHYDLLKSRSIRGISRSVSIIGLYYIMKYRKIRGLDTQGLVRIFEREFRVNGEWVGDRKENAIDDIVTKYFVYLILREFDGDEELLKNAIKYFQERFDGWYNEYEEQLIINYESFFAYLVLKNEDLLYPIESVYLNFDPYKEKLDLRILFFYYVSLAENAKAEYGGVEIRDINGLKKFLLKVLKKIFANRDLEILNRILRDSKNMPKIMLSPRLKRFLLHSILVCRYERYGILINYPSSQKDYNFWGFPWEMHPRDFFYYHLALGLMAFLLRIDKELLANLEKLVSVKYKYVQERRPIYGAFYPYVLYKEKAHELESFLMRIQNKKPLPEFYNSNFKFYELRDVEIKDKIRVYPKYLAKWGKNWDLRLVVAIRNERLKEQLRKINDDLQSNRNWILLKIRKFEDEEYFTIVRAKDSRDTLQKLTGFLDNFANSSIENLIIIKGDIRKFSISVNREAFLEVLKRTCDIDESSLDVIKKIINNLSLINYRGSIPIFRGIPEGIPINPALLELVFIILLYQAYKCIQKRYNEGFIRIFVFNEDFVIISNNRELMRSYYRCLERYLSFVGWEISKEKAKIVSLGNRELAKELGLSWGDEFNYLGAKIRIKNEDPPYDIIFDDKRLKRLKWYLATRFVNRLVNLDMITYKLELDVYTKNGLINKLKEDCEKVFYDGSDQVSEVERWLMEIAQEALRFLGKGKIEFRENKELWDAFEHELAEKLRSFVHKDTKIYVVTDAAYSKRENLAGYGILIQNLNTGEKICYKYVESGIESSQLAEVRAILRGISLAKEKFGEKHMLLISDNKHIIRAINKRSRIKNPRVQEVIEHIRTYKDIEFTYKPEKTELIRKVDIISKKALEQIKKGKLEYSKIYKEECPHVESAFE